MRIKVGDGLSQIIGPAAGDDIIATQMKPEFQRNDYAAGLRAAVSNIMWRIDNNIVDATGPQDFLSKAIHLFQRSPGLFVVIGVVAFVVLLTMIRRSLPVRYPATTHQSQDEAEAAERRQIYRDYNRHNDNRFGWFGRGTRSYGSRPPGSGGKFSGGGSSGSW